MPVSRWFLLLAAMVALGALQVAQRTAIVLKGYALGERMDRLHTQATHAALETMEVAGLVSPAHLSQAVKDRQMQLVAWSALQENPEIGE